MINDFNSTSTSGNCKTRATYYVNTIKQLRHFILLVD